MILAANDNFLRAVGYTLAEIRGKHHRMFVDPVQRESPEYRSFWARLARGEFDSGEYKRLAKGGREIRLQATYNPIFDSRGRRFKVVKYASDITSSMLRRANGEGQLAAIDKAQAVIEFELDGTIRHANENFLRTMGYSLDQVRGKHHGMFVDPALRDSAEYRAFWARLGRGEYDSGRYKRVAHGGREVWLQASYNPILDNTGKPQIRDMAGEVRVGVEEISDGNINLSQRTSQQAASLEETASSMEEMATTVKQTAENATQANQLAIAAQTQAEKGGGVVAAFAISRDAAPQRPRKSRL